MVTTASQTAAPSCAATLNALKTKIETNYAGFLLEVQGPRHENYQTLFDSLTRAAATAHGDACYYVLDQFTRWFADPHLFVFQSTQLDTAETAKRARAMRLTPVTEAGARAYFNSSAPALDAIEGIWRDGNGLRVAVVPDPSARGSLIAVVLTSDTAIWVAGAVRATITAAKRGTYAIALASRNHAVRQLQGVIHKEVILRLSPGVWAKEYPAVSTDGLVDGRDPRRPTLLSRGKTVIVSLVSHDPMYARVVDSLIAANDLALRTAERLIIDLRGNEGGSSWITNPLLPFIRSGQRRAHGSAGDTAVMLSSPDQIAYAKRAFGADTSAFVREIVRRLTETPGKLVPLPQSSTPRDTLVVGQARVGVIVDRGTVSASEVLVLRAKESARATVFGEPTAGALDYQSVNIVRILPDESRWFLGYPTIAASGHLPTNGMRSKGIAPDVSLRVSGLWQAIDEVDRELARQGARPGT